MSLSFDKLRLIAEKYPLLHRLFYRTAPLVYGDHTQMTPPSKETVLVIPPRYYWVKRANLKVKTSKEAASYGTALFDLDDTYTYQAQSIGNHDFILIAYNQSEIAKEVLSNPKFESIEKITFAQWVFATESHPIRLSEEKSLAIVDGVVVEMDSSYLLQKETLSLDEALSHPKYHLPTLPREAFAPAVLTPKTLRVTFIIAVLLFGNFATHAVVNYQESVNIERTIQEELQRSKLPETSIERQSIAETLKIKEKKQLRLRQACKELSDIPVEVKTANPPPPAPITPPPVSSSAEGIVLIPGSKPGEANRLIVDNTLSAPVVAFHTEGMRELNYDGKTITLLIDTHDSNAGAKLKEEIKKQLRHAEVREDNKQLEVRLR
ncbi:MAG: hypothetical protein PHW18_01970 [Sulfuricurvum sp.]|uniref:hypothetical protein n=1 Tax=Sulfuricurvum sp. TaxID=2025608 RepID=UPI00262D3F26|nr:hypothetical protein [Sulfuricurvum sp.]MDD2828322.1 hypothetical protein [Sulfuricurvum sp.]MDD4949723.1 hypothetical protein [Sulfuricurvum sp.]